MKQIRWGVAILATAIAFQGFGETHAVQASTYAQDALKKYVDSGELPGAISVFYKNGREEVACVGWADVDKRTPMSMDRTFMICSQTKGFCGVCIAMLVEEGKISLDDPVSKYLPEFKQLWIETSNSNGVRTLVKAKNTLTIRHVMSHTGGFPFEVPFKSTLGWPGAPIRVTAAAAAAYPIKFEPGTKASYSNTGIDIGAAVVEVVTGKKWDVFLKERVLTPLGMKDTTFNPTDEQLSRAISMYDVKGGQKAKWRAFNNWMPLPHNGPDVYPSAGAGLWSTSQDLLKFYQMLMRKGLGENGTRILKEETVTDILAKKQTPDGVSYSYSLGLSVEGTTGWFGHGGAWGTNCSVNWKTQELKFWVVQFNGEPRPWNSAWYQATEKFFNQKIDTVAIDAHTGRTKE